MQLKLVAAIAVLLLVSLSIAGCSTSKTNQTQSASPTPLAADNLADAINDLYKKTNYTLSTPFTMTQQGDTITYHGVVVETNGYPRCFNNPYHYNVTIVLIKDDSPTGITTAADAYKNIQSTLETRHPSFTITYGTDYSPHKGEYVNGSAYRVDKFDPTQNGAVVPSIDRGSAFAYHLYLDNADMSNYYEILSIEQLSYYGSIAD